ncbi:MAG: hypothetical protein AAF432_06915 [Planctomycetota bacterium]
MSRGRTAKKERKLHKAKPQRRLTLCALVILVGAYALQVTPGVKQRGWVAAVPDVVLIASLPWTAESGTPNMQWMLRFAIFSGAGNGAHPFCSELDIRISRATISRFEFNLLVEFARLANQRDAQNLRSFAMTDFAQQGSTHYTLYPITARRIERDATVEFWCDSTEQQYVTFEIVVSEHFLPSMCDMTLHHAATGELIPDRMDSRMINYGNPDPVEFLAWISRRTNSLHTLQYEEVTELEVRIRRRHGDAPGPTIFSKTYEIGDSEIGLRFTDPLRTSS